MHQKYNRKKRRNWWPKNLPRKCRIQSNRMQRLVFLYLIVAVSLLATRFHFNIIPKNNFLDSTKFKEFADVNLDVTGKKNSDFARVENTVGEGENAGKKLFPLSRPCFLKLSLSRSLKVGIVC